MDWKTNSARRLVIYSYLTFSKKGVVVLYHWTDPIRYYAVVSEVPTMTQKVSMWKPLNVLGYIRVLPEELPASVARNQFPKQLTHLIECEYPEAVARAGNIGFLGGQF